MSIQRWLNMPKRAAITRSPGESVLLSAASQAPVPLAGKMNAWPSFVLKTFLRSRSTGAASSGKVDDRWSSIGRCIALRMRSGTFVGPGTNRKLRPGMQDLGEKEKPFARAHRLERIPLRREDGDVVYCPRLAPFPASAEP